MGAWSGFFTGELTAASAFAGLLFVSLSVNQARILEVDRLAERGLEGLTLLLLVVLVASCGLVPGQPPRWVGAEITLVALGTLGRILRLQKLYMPVTQATYRQRAMRLTWMNRVAVCAVAAAGLLLTATADLRSLYVLPVGVLLSFIAAGISAWVLLIEISR